MSLAISAPTARIPAFLVCFGLLVSTGNSGAQAPAATIERFTAATTAIKPAGVELRIDVKNWSADDARKAVVQALAPDAAAKTLGALPTVGYVWPSKSGVGYAVKYAERTRTADGERVTLVTAPALGSYDFTPWQADQPAAQTSRDYSVIELKFDARGRGDGTLSIAAAVELDRERGLVTLGTGDRVLTRVEKVSDAQTNTGG